MGAVKLAVFDIDGTLIRTGGAGVRAFDRTGRSVFQTTRPLFLSTAAMNWAWTSSSMLWICARWPGSAGEKGSSPN